MKDKSKLQEAKEFLNMIIDNGELAYYKNLYHLPEFPSDWDKIEFYRQYRVDTAHRNDVESQISGGHPETPIDYQNSANMIETSSRSQENDKGIAVEDKIAFVKDYLNDGIFRNSSEDKLNDVQIVAVSALLSHKEKQYNQKIKELEAAIQFGVDLESGNIERDFKNYRSSVEQFLSSLNK